MTVSVMLSLAAAVFSFVDGVGRSRFPSVLSRLGVFERTLGVRGAKEYKTGYAFHVEDLRSSATMHAYNSYLTEKGINIEHVIKWFFSDYLKGKYGAEGFRFNPSSETSGLAEKSKNLCSEMEGILKQYKLFVDTGGIDRELFEIASSAISFESIPSQIPRKYAYANSETIQQEQFLLFSDQSMLAYVPEHQEYHSFAEMAIKEEVTVDDYSRHDKPGLDFLAERKAISTDESRIIVNQGRVALLKDLNDNDVICLRYCDGWQERIIDSLVASKDIVVESKLFTKPESDYLNYMLNKSMFSNGLDLRNRYAHGTYSKDEREQSQDYIRLLKIMIMVLLKIREEFILKNDA